MKVATRAALATFLILSAGWPAPGQELSPKGSLKCPARLRSVTFSPAGDTLAGICQGFVVVVWDLSRGEIVATLKGHTDCVTALAFSPDGKTLASGGREVRLWDVATRKQTAALEGSRHFAGCLAFTPDGKTLASGGEAEEIRLWDVATGKEKANFKGHVGGICCLAFSPDGKTLASGSEDHSAHLWDVATGQTGPPLFGSRAPVGFAHKFGLLAEFMCRMAESCRKSLCDGPRTGPAGRIYVQKAILVQSRPCPTSGIQPRRENPAHGG